MVCLETTFLVDFLRGKEEAESVFNDLVDKRSQITITSPSLMEIMSGAHNNQKKEELRKIEEVILSKVIILNLDKESAILAGEIDSELTLSGDSIGTTDIMIGAIAKHNNETLITRNKKHFERINGLKIESY